MPLYRIFTLVICPVILGTVLLFGEGCQDQPKHEEAVQQMNDTTGASKQSDTGQSLKDSEDTEVESKNELYTYLDTLEARYEAACYEIGIANWNSYSKEAPYDLDAAKKALGEIFLDSAARATIRTWRDRSGSLADKELARRLELWHRCFIGGAIYADTAIARLENELQEKITNFPFRHDGKSITRAQVTNLIRQEKRQAARHKLWSVTSQVSAAAADDLLALVTLRNEKARAFGYPNYYSLALDVQAIDEEWLLKTLTALAEATEKPYADFIASSQKKLRIKEFNAWDFDYALREGVSLPNKYFPPDSVFDVIHRFERGIGFKVDSLPIKEVIKDIPYGGLSLAITIPTDSRFLVNPTKGHRFYTTAFHEYGHSLKAVHINTNYPIFKGYEWVPGAQCAAFEEGVAEMHGEFTDESHWITNFTKAKPREIERYMEGRSLPALNRLRGLLKNFFFEYEMYKDPDQNLDSLEKAIVKKYQLVELPENEPHQFAASIWYTAYPCYYQNYILAAMMAVQFQEALSSKFGEVDKLTDPRVSEWMIEHLYRDGERLEWTERVRHATGKSLDTGPYLRKLGIVLTENITRD